MPCDLWTPGLDEIDLACPVNWASPLNDGLVSRNLVLPNISGGTKLHDIASQNDGTLTNGPTWTPDGPTGSLGSLRLNSASDQYVNLGNPSNLRITGNCTVAIWVYFVALPSGGNGMCLLTKDKDSGGRAYNLDYTDFYGAFRFFHSGGGNTATNESRYVLTPTLGVWYHVVGTFGTNGTLAVYVNGVAGGSIITSGGSSSINDATTANVLLGRQEYSGFTGPLNGYINDGCIFNVTKSASQVWDFYQDALAGYPESINRLPLDYIRTQGSTTYTGSAALTTGPIALAATATFAPGTHTATCAASVGHVAVGSTATFAPGTHTSTAAPSVGHVAIACTATFAPGTHTATAAASVGHVALASSATFAGGTHTASAALAVGHVALSSSAIFAAAVYSGSGSLAVGHVAVGGSATFTAPAPSTYTGSAAPAIGHVAVTSTAQFTGVAGSYTASCAIVCGGIEVAIEGNSWSGTPSEMHMTEYNVRVAGFTEFNVRVAGFTDVLALGA